jgi:hypothetical protein
MRQLPRSRDRKPLPTVGHPGGTRPAVVEHLERRALLSTTGTAVTTTTLVAAADHVMLDGTDTFTATVAPAVAGGPTPTGSVEFFSYNGTYPSKTATLTAAGTASVTVSATIEGHIAFIAEYSGDATYAPSKSGGLSEAVNGTPVVLTFGKDTVPTALVAGSKLAKGSIVVNLNNPSGVTLSGGRLIDVYAVQYNGGASFSAVVVGSVKASPKIPAGATKSYTVKVNALTEAETAGTYFLTASATDEEKFTSYTPSGSDSPDDFTVAAAYVALTGTVSAVTPAAVTPGKTLSFTLTLDNSGNVNSTGKATLAVYLSADGTALTVPITPTLTKSLTVKPGKPLPVRLSVKVPTTAPAGSFFPLVTVVQGTATTTAAATTKVAVG